MQQNSGKEISIAKFKDGRKEVYDTSVWGVEKPGVDVYTIQTVTLERWNWILSHPDEKQVIQSLFPNF